MREEIEKIMNLLQEKFLPFEGTEYPMPVSQAILGDMPKLPELRNWLDEACQGQLKGAMEPVAVASEVIESSADDRNDFFLNDVRVQRIVFQGAKWRAGWVLLAGDGVTDKLAHQLEVFCFDGAITDTALPCVGP